MKLDSTPKIVLFDDLSSSLYNGIGTYKYVFKEDVRYFKYDLMIVSSVPKSNKLSYSKYLWGEEILIPCDLFSYSSSDHISEACDYLSRCLCDDCSNFFIINNFPCYYLTIELRKRFTKSHYIFIIHNQPWCIPLLGDVITYTDYINSQINENVLSEDDSPILDDFREEKRAYDLMDMIVSLSPSTYNIIKSLYNIDESKLVYIPNGVFEITSNYITNVALTRIKSMCNPNDKIIVTISRMTEDKGIRPLLSLIKRIKRDRLSVKLILIGNPKGLQEYSDILNSINDYIILTGFLNRKELNAILSIADVGIIPSYTEQCSFAALELMQHRLIIVSSDGHNLESMFTNNINAFVAEIGKRKDPQEFINNLYDMTISALNCNNAIKRRYINHNLNLIRTKYSAKLMLLNYMKQT